MKRGMTLLSAVLMFAARSIASPVVEDVRIACDGGILTVSYSLSEEAIVTAEILSGDEPLNAGTVVLEGDVNRVVAAGESCVFTCNARVFPSARAYEKLSARVTAWPKDDPPDYMVVDLCPVSTARIRYYQTAEDLPGGIISNGIYRTSSLVMRRIRAKGVTWRMGSDSEIGRYEDGSEDGHDVTLDHDYYIGVFELTMGQLATISGGTVYGDATYKAKANWSFFPVQRLTYNDMRSPLPPAEPGDSTKLGKLKALTGFVFDLPTEAEWEFAARAGNYDGKWSDGSDILSSTGEDANLAKLARYTKTNGGGGWNGTIDITGAREPNDWGLYDVHGNEAEYCLDWYQTDITELGGRLAVDAGDPSLGADGASGTKRVARGGYFACSARDVRAAARRLAFSPVESKTELSYRLLARRSGLSTGWNPVAVSSGNTVSITNGPWSADAAAEVADTRAFAESAGVSERRASTAPANTVLILR